MGSRSQISYVTDTAFRHTLTFEWLHEPGKGIGFRCDEAGCVDIASLSKSMQMIYQGALAMVGNYYSRPTIQFAQ